MNATLITISASLVLETVVTPGRVSRNILFITAILLIVAGVSSGIAMQQFFFILAVLLGVGLLVWLIHSEPKAIYAEYLRIDENGIKYSHSPGASGRVSLYKWDEIDSVSLSSDPSGISVFTTRPDLKGVGLFLFIHTHADAQSAFVTASDRLRSSAL